MTQTVGKGSFGLYSIDGIRDFLQTIARLRCALFKMWNAFSILCKQEELEYVQLA